MDRDKVMMFIDGENLFYGCKNYGKERDGKTFKIDLAKMRDALVGDRILRRAYFYGSIPSDPRSEEEKERIEKQQRYYRSLDYQGFKTTIIPLKKRQIEHTCARCGHTSITETQIEKGVDVALVADMLSIGLSGSFDVAILVSGDYDYHKAVEELQRRGVIVEVAYFRHHGINKDLIRIADRFIDLEKIAGQIEKTT